MMITNGRHKYVNLGIFWSIKSKHLPKRYAKRGDMYKEVRENKDRVFLKLKNLLIKDSCQGTRGFLYIFLIAVGKRNAMAL